jgi:hypothetical protein
MIDIMQSNQNLQLASVADLSKYVEYDRSKVAKYKGTNAQEAVATMWDCLLTEGITAEVILVYSRVDHKIYAMEGNTKIAAAKKHKKAIQYLPARVVAVDYASPRKKGVEAERWLKSSDRGTHFPPSRFGIVVADTQLLNNSVE